MVQVKEKLMCSCGNAQAYQGGLCRRCISVKKRAEYGEPKIIPIDDIKSDGGTQFRVQIHQDVIQEYAELYRIGLALPDPVVFWDGMNYWLADGHQRTEAARLAKKTHLSCFVRQGTLEDAQQFAHGANETHGSRRTLEDRQNSVRKALSHPGWENRSDTWIAEICSVSQGLVKRIREPATNGQKRIGKDGREQKATREPGDREKKGAPETNGKAEYDMKGFYADWGALMREIDQLGNLHNSKESVSAAGLRRQLGEFKANFKKWYKSLVKKDAPEE